MEGKEKKRKRKKKKRKKRKRKKKKRKKKKRKKREEPKGMDGLLLSINMCPTGDRNKNKSAIGVSSE